MSWLYTGGAGGRAGEGRPAADKSGCCFCLDCCRAGTAFPTINHALPFTNNHCRWYHCPDFGYDFKQCMVCDGPKARCVSHYTLPYRCARGDRGTRTASASTSNHQALSENLRTAARPPPLLSNLLLLSVQVCHRDVLGLHHHDHRRLRRHQQRDGGRKGGRDTLLHCLRSGGDSAGFRWIRLPSCVRVHS